MDTHDRTNLAETLISIQLYGADRTEIEGVIEKCCSAARVDLSIYRHSADRTEYIFTCLGFSKRAELSHLESSSEYSVRDALFFGVNDYIFHLPGGSTEPSCLAEALYAIERELNILARTFSTKVLNRIKSLNPLTRIIAGKRKRAEFSLSGVRLIMREHFLLEKMNLLDALFELGLDPSSCCLIPKDDKTPYRERIANAMISRGAMVVQSLDAAGKKQIEKFLLLEPSKLSVVLDDGAELIAYCRELENDTSYSMNGTIYLETTSRGVRSLETKHPNLSYVNLSSCSIKDAMSCGIASSFVHRFRQILHREGLYQEPIHVVGFGRIGQEICVQLHSLGMKVSVSDTNPERRAIARQAGYEVFTSPSIGLSKIPTRFIIGASGNPSIGGSEVNLLMKPAVMASISSQDLRLAKSYLLESDHQKKDTCFGDMYFRSGELCVVILGGGHALNLFGVEGVNEPDFDPFIALIFAAIVESSRHTSYGSWDVQTLCAEIELEQQMMRPTRYLLLDRWFSVAEGTAP